VQKVAGRHRFAAKQEAITKTLWTISSLLFCIASCYVAASTPGTPALDKMKSLVGTWEGKTADGRLVTTSYHLTAGGTAVMEESSVDHMITMFYVVGDRLALTHYCSVGNQPHMEATISSDGTTLDFVFVGGTNIPVLKTGHMHRAVFRLVDADHYTEDWTWTKDGKSVSEHFEMRRKQ
jgi:hypothetical protein